VNRTYNENKSSEVRALRDINMEIDKGEMVAILGPSGSGKSTLLHILGCIDADYHGTYLLYDENMTMKSDKEIANIRNKKLGFVLQEYGLLLDKTVLENVSIPLWFSDCKIRYIKNKCLVILKILGIQDYYNKKVNELSGGQKQRVAIARALVNDPDIILADEPTGALDQTTSEEIMEELRKLNQAGKTIIIVTHDPRISEVCTKTFHIVDGTIRLIPN
jgi:putative ABC transport system ATP-binding protein